MYCTVRFVELVGEYACCLRSKLRLNLPAWSKSLLNEAIRTGLVLSMFELKLISLVPETPVVDKLFIENLFACS